LPDKWLLDDSFCPFGPKAKIALKGFRCGWYQGAMKAGKSFITVFLASLKKPAPYKAALSSMLYDLENEYLTKSSFAYLTDLRKPFQTIDACLKAETMPSIRNFTERNK